MTLDDFRKAAEFLIAHGIAVRAFILLKPPFMQDSESVEWALRSVVFAFDCGARACAVIPTRSGNGLIDQLEREKQFRPPSLPALEEALSRGLALQRGRVFVDLWDAGRLAACSRCGPARIERLRQMNLAQRILPAIDCACA
jgi:uncharacterized Fe-S cluster-containing MiaB family protein